MTRTTRTAAAIATALLVGGFATSASAITVTPNTDATQLANVLLGSGVTLSGTPTLSGGSSSSGTFTGGNSSGIGIDEGIVLTNGDASSIDNSNDADDTSTDFSGAGDSDLDAIVSPDVTFDATVLEFDFNTTTGDLFFNYVFGSEEYNEFIGSFNDVFAFFLDGINIAIAPDGNPVSIDNVNCGNPYAGSGPNCAYFNNNDPSDGGPFFNFEYDGFTDVFTASALGLAAGTHHIKLAIADTNDHALDSGVFLQAGSFSGTKPPTPGVPEPSTLGLFGLGVLGVFAGTALRRRRQQG